MAGLLFLNTNLENLFALLKFNKGFKLWRFVLMASATIAVANLLFKYFYYVSFEVCND